MGVTMSKIKILLEILILCDTTPLPSLVVGRVLKMKSTRMGRGKWEICIVFVHFGRTGSGDGPKETVLEFLVGRICV